MILKELLDELKDFNLNAKVGVITCNRREDFSITWNGDGEGVTKNDCKEVHFYVDKLCRNEVEGK